MFVWIDNSPEVGLLEAIRLSWKTGSSEIDVLDASLGTFLESLFPQP